MCSVATATATRYFLAAAVPIHHSCGCNLLFVILINYPAQTFSSVSPLAPENDDSKKNHENTFILLNYAKEYVLVFEMTSVTEPHT